MGYFFFFFFFFFQAEDGIRDYKVTGVQTCALPIFRAGSIRQQAARSSTGSCHSSAPDRSEEHTSELQSPCNLVCRLLLEKKNDVSIIYFWTVSLPANGKWRGPHSKRRGT